MISLSLYVMLKLSTTTSPQILFPSDCNTLYKNWCFSVETEDPEIEEQKKESLQTDLLYKGRLIDWLLILLIDWL